MNKKLYNKFNKNRNKKERKQKKEKEVSDNITGYDVDEKEKIHHKLLKIIKNE